MKKIVGFFVNQFSERGTEIATFNYALYNQKILNNTSIIICSKNTDTHIEMVKKINSFRLFVKDLFDSTSIK